MTWLMRAVVVATLGLVSLSAWAQYDVVISRSKLFGPEEVRTYHFLETGDLELQQMDSNTDFKGIAIDPYGNWMCIWQGGLRLYSLSELASFEIVDEIGEELQGYSNSNLITRLDGEAFLTLSFLPQNESTYLQTVFVEGETTLNPSPVSFEILDGDLDSLSTKILAGNNIAFGQWLNQYHTYEYDQTTGAIGPSSERFEWEPLSAEGNYDSRELTISRDGRLIISTGVNSSSSPEAMHAASHWVSPDGTVTEVDRLTRQEITASGTLSGFSNIRNVRISPDRDWVMFVSNSKAYAWRLNPNGSFGDFLWVLREDIFSTGGGDISADGRLVVLGMARDLDVAPWITDGLMFLQVSPEGELLGEEYHVIKEGFGAYIRAAFITRRVPGDCNGDGWIDAADLVTLINHVRDGIEIPNPVDFDNADVDRDDDRDDDDIAMLVGMLVGN